MATDATWTVYYPDGTTFSSLDGAPWDAPFRNIACIGDKTNACTLFGWEWFYWHEGIGQWEGSDLNGILYQLCENASLIRAIRKGAYFQADPFLQRLIWRAFVDRMP